MEAIREAPKTYYVYTYAFPDGKVFYVGKGTDNRINAHEREAKNGCVCRKCEAIRSIWDAGQPVQKRIVNETFDEQEAYRIERELIEQHYSDILTNLRDTPGYVKYRMVKPKKTFIGNRKPPKTVKSFNVEYVALLDAMIYLDCPKMIVFRYMAEAKITSRSLPLRGSSQYLLKSDYKLIAKRWKADKPK